ncbi:MAG TPA: hypothetical protein VJT73_14270, partial [Polyangiaceae bacterium]|nr:hypothetical protein [Polyangiaceae bacterium]
AYALAATKDLPVTGANVAKGLRKLAGGPTTIEVGNAKILAAFQRLSVGEKINAIGTFVPLDWDSLGAAQGGTVEIWCISGTNTAPVFESSAKTFDLKTKTFATDPTNTKCQF